MSDPSAPLEALAAAAGLCVDWTDGAGERKRVGPDSLRQVLDALGWPAADDRQCGKSLRALQDAESAHIPTLFTADAGCPVAVGGRPGQRYQLRDASGGVTDGRFDAEGHVAGIAAAGYHQLEWNDQTSTLAVAPPTCFGMSDACGDPDPHRWGVGLQVYSARSASDGGVGDASGALEWIERLAMAGGDALALSPLHAARLDATHASPYSPGDRRFLDPVHAAPALVTGAAFAETASEHAGLRERFDALASATLVDWAGVRRARWEWLRAMHARRDALPAGLQTDLAAFVHERGQALQHYARVASGELDGGVTEEGMSLQCFAQWLAARSWSAVQARAHALGMRPGLIADLAVGFDPGGSEARAWPDAVLQGLTLGAPPDAFDANGQAWGIGSYSPDGLRLHGFAPFLQLLRAVMRNRGGVRIDHILGLMRLWVVPEGAGSAAGVYLRQPFEDLLRLLVLESWQHRAVVIGEDLGVVPDGLRDILAARGVLGIDVLLFTRDDDGAFLPPAQWRRNAVATTTTHDLPTLAGWRSGRDLAWRARIAAGEAADGMPDADADAADIESGGGTGDGAARYSGESSGHQSSGSDDRRARQRDVARLGEQVSATLGGDGRDPLDWLRFTALGPSPLALLPAEDALALVEQPNLPGTVDQHPNWRRRLPAALPEDVLATRLRAFAQARSGAPDRAMTSDTRVDP